MVCVGKMGIAISQVFASLEPCFHARFLVRMAIRRLTKKRSSGDEFNRKISYTHLTPRVASLPPKTLVLR